MVNSIKIVVEDVEKCPPETIQAFINVLQKVLETKGAHPRRAVSEEEKRAAMLDFNGFDRTFDGRETFQLKEKTIETILKIFFYGLSIGILIGHFLVPLISKYIK